ncbi:MAG: glucose 1-dehydrogenase [Ruminococcaceae bacterium]|nr:glucose 1-dehydrogenase [Oscillospiraceae bacterium]
MDKVAIITGGSRGIGRAAARRLAHSGYAVCINYRERRDAAEQLCDELTAAGCRAMTWQADVADASAVGAMANAVREAFGPISLLVSNAGIAGQMQFQDVTEAQWNRYFDVNVKGAFNAVQAVLPDMLHAHAGSIVTVSSMWGLRGASCEVVYSATKAALIGLTRSLAMELAPTGIRVNCVCPGVINTDMVQVLGQETLDELAHMTPLGRLGTPEDIAAAICYFASDESSFVTGQVLTADGGFIL